MILMLVSPDPPCEMLTLAAKEHEMKFAKAAVRAPHLLLAISAAR